MARVTVADVILGHVDSARRDLADGVSTVDARERVGSEVQASQHELVVLDAGTDTSTTRFTVDVVRDRLEARPSVNVTTAYPRCLRP
ncbi:MAG: hypothetical protein R3B96_03805 [Pirellulaceae bacterium]